jgi:hypothetical protein
MDYVMPFVRLRDGDIAPGDDQSDGMRHAEQRGGDHFLAFTEHSDCEITSALRTSYDGCTINVT